MVISICFTYILKQEKMGGGGGERTGTMFFPNILYTEGTKIPTGKQSFFWQSEFRLMLTK